MARYSRSGPSGRSIAADLAWIGGWVFVGGLFLNHMKATNWGEPRPTPRIAAPVAAPVQRDNRYPVPYELPPGRH